MMKQVELEREVQDSHARLARVEARLQQIEQEGKPPPYEVTTKSVEEMVIASVRQLVPKPQEMDYYCKQMYTTLYRGLDDLGISPRYPEVTFYHNEEYPETDLDVETAVVVSEQSMSHHRNTHTFKFAPHPQKKMWRFLSQRGHFGMLVLL